MADAINGLASLATGLGDWHRAAVLHGAAQALIDQTGLQPEGLDDRYRQESLVQARAALGDEQAQRAYACGMALGLDQVIDLALGRVPPGTQPAVLCRSTATRPPPTSGTESAPSSRGRQPTGGHHR
jgi:hypothetical protein